MNSLQRESRPPVVVSVNDLNDATFASYRRALRSRNRSPRTIESYAMAFRELNAFLGGTDITMALKNDIEGFLEKRLSVISPTTVAIRFRSLRTFYTWAVEEGIIPSSPMKGLTEPKAQPKPVAVLSDDDLKAMIKVCSGRSFESKRDDPAPL